MYSSDIEEMFTSTMLRFVTLHTVADGANVGSGDQVHLHLLHLLHEAVHWVQRRYWFTKY